MQFLLFQILKFKITLKDQIWFPLSLKNDSFYIHLSF